MEHINDEDLELYALGRVVLSLDKEDHVIECYQCLSRVLYEIEIAEIICKALRSSRTSILPSIVKVKVILATAAALVPLQEFLPAVLPTLAG